MTNQIETSKRTHRRAVRFFWSLLIGATLVSLVGNITHAVLSYIPRIVVQIGAAAVPPVALLAAVHGIALAVRAGASGTVYRWAVSAVAAIGAGAFSVSFIALRDLMRMIGYTTATAWVFPAIIDTAVAVSTLMLVALEDKPARRSRTAHPSADAHSHPAQTPPQSPTQSAKAQVRPSARKFIQSQASRPVQPPPAQTMQAPVQTEARQIDTDLAAELIASDATTQRVETVIAVLAASRAGSSINAAAKAAGINYRTAQRIVEAATEQRLLFAVG
jgi:hypothetical protein